MNNINNELYELCKLYTFEYTIYLEKIKVKKINPNKISDESIMNSNQELLRIKEEILNKLLSEVITESNGENKLNKNTENRDNNNKSFFKMMF